MEQSLISPIIRHQYAFLPYIPMSQEHWVTGQAGGFDVEIGERILLQRDYELVRNQWVVRDYLLMKAPSAIYGGWILQTHLYHLAEGTPYPVQHVRLCQPVRFWKYVAGASPGMFRRVPYVGDSLPRA